MLANNALVHKPLEWCPCGWRPLRKRT